MGGRGVFPDAEGWLLVCNYSHPLWGFEPDDICKTKASGYTAFQASLTRIFPCIFCIRLTFLLHGALPKCYACP